MRLKDAETIKSRIGELCINNDDLYSERAYERIIGVIEAVPTIDAEPVKRTGCEYCKGRAYTEKPLTVITRTLKRVEVVFEYCPKCGRKMKRGAENA